MTHPTSYTSYMTSQMKLLASLLALIILATVSGFTSKPSLLQSRCLLRASKVEVGDSSSVADGKSIVVKTPVGDVIVASLKGKFYAVNAKCPHLGDIISQATTSHINFCYCVHIFILNY